MKKFALLASVATGVMLVSAPAMAEQSPATAPQTAQEADQEASNDGFADAIVVTARRRAEDASKVPIAITAFSGDQLVAKGVQSVGDLTKFTPGLNISGGGTKTAPFIVIRGQSKAVTGNSSPGVITYMNDVPLPNAGSLIQTYDMENIQVLKGPQGTLFGRNSIGGAVLTVTKGASHEFGGYVTGEIANHDFTQVEGAINVPLVQDKVALRLAAQVGHDGGDIETFAYQPYTIANPSVGVYVANPGQLNPTAHNADEYATESYRASLLIEPTDWIKSVTVGDYTKVRGTNNQTFGAAYPGGFNGGPPAFFFQEQADIATALGGTAFANTYAGIVGSLAQCPSGAINCNITSAIAAAQDSQSGRYNFLTQDPWKSVAVIKGISNTTTIKLGDNHQLKNIFALRTTSTYTDATLTGLAIPTILTASQTKLKQTTEEIQLSGSFFDNDLKYTVGGFFYNEKPNGLGGYQALEVNAFFGLSHTLSTTYLHNSSKAVYGQLDYSLDKLIPGLSLTAGLRQTWDTQSACTTSVKFSPFGEAVVLAAPAGPGDGILPSESDCTNGVGPNNSLSLVFPDAKFKKLTYTFGANWQVTPDAMIYVAHRRGYRAGGYNTPTFDPYLSDIQTFKPETLTDWEAGLKARFRAGDVRGTLDLAVFTGKDTDNQLPVSTANLAAGVCLPEALGTTGHMTSDCTAAGGIAGSLVPITAATTTANAAKLTISGIEAAGTLSPFRGLTFSGSVAYTQVKVDSITLSPTSPFGILLNAIGRPVNTSSVAIQGQPKWTSNAGVTVYYPEQVLGGDLTASVDYHYNGSYRSVQIDVPSWHQIDARFSLANIGDTGVSAAVYVKNLTNEATFLGTGSSSPGGVGSSGYIIGKSRTVGMSLNYKFGN
ncbi:MAG: TonB-dependent receptor [Novosphingobium sp.]